MDENVKKIRKKKVSNSAKFMIIGIIFIAVFCVVITPKNLQNDTFYTIKVGEEISKNGIDMKDHFSWHENLNYTYPHWLYDLCMYNVYLNFGMNGIFISTCILSCILGVSLYLVSSKLTKEKVISFFVTFGAMFVLEPYIAARAQLVTFILFIWEIFFIERFLEKPKIKYCFMLILISILIANLHVAVWPFFFVLFLPYIVEYLVWKISDLVIYYKIKVWRLKFLIKILEKNNNKVKKSKEEKILKLNQKLKDLEERISKIKIRREENNRKVYKIEIVKNKNVKYLIILMLICILTGFLTPLEDVPYTYLYKTMKGNTTQNINEHLPMTIIENEEAMSIIIILLAILMFTKTKIKLSDLFFLGGLVFLMLVTRRQITMLVIIGTVILTRMIKNLFKEYNVKINKSLDFLVQPLVISFMFVLLIFISYIKVKPNLKSKFISEDSYPVKACDFIIEKSKNLDIDLSKAKFFNDYNYGSYMLFRGIPVFIDSRADLYAPEFSGLENDIFMDYINTSSLKIFYEDTFEKYGISHVITYKDSKMNNIIKKVSDKNLKQIYEDSNFTIYERLNSEYFKE